MNDNGFKSGYKAWQRVLVCGGRDYSDQVTLDASLDKIHRDCAIGCLIQGGARGADSLADRWARRNNIPVMQFNAPWETMGRQAGHIRNAWMLEWGNPHLVVAFPGGRGTDSMIALARKAQVEVIEVVE